MIYIYKFSSLKINEKKEKERRKKVKYNNFISSNSKFQSQFSNLITSANNFSSYKYFFIDILGK